jgi:hypothetical protein
MNSNRKYKIENENRKRKRREKLIWTLPDCSSPITSPPEAQHPGLAQPA